MKSQHIKNSGVVSEHSISENFIEALELPKDLLLGMPVLTLTGDREILIENHRGIVFYSEEKMIISCKEKTLEITGSALSIVYYTKDSVKIQGRIAQILFGS